jgi:hypothetical protein
MGLRGMKRSSKEDCPVISAAGGSAWLALVIARPAINTIVRTKVVFQTSTGFMKIKIESQDFIDF